MANMSFHYVDNKERVTIHLADGRIVIGKRGSTLEEFIKFAHPEDFHKFMGGVVNGRLRELTFKIEWESDVQLIDTSSQDGGRIYRRSLIFLLEAAFYELFPERELFIDHSVFAGGYLCKISDGLKLREGQIKALETRMKEIVEDNEPFERLQVPLEAAIAYFTANNMQDKVDLLKHRKKDYLQLYRFRELRDYHHGYMVPTSGYLKWFALEHSEYGMILRFPRKSEPTVLQKFIHNPKLMDTFKLYGDWLENLGIGSVGALNDSIKDGRINSVILVSEALHEQRVAEIARQIDARKDEIRVILVAGPSSSGKTTFSKRLTIQLLSHGISPFPLEMDNYFVDRDQTPLDEHGEFDFENFDAINRTQLNEDLNSLISCFETQLIDFDFFTGKSKPGKTIQLQSGQPVIVEGIHGLNPELIPDVPEEQIFRVYLSALTQLNLDRHNRVSTTDTRLVRRLVRDARERGYSPQETISRWGSVRKGEKKNIFPYQENADVIFNSALVYELAVLKKYAEPLLRQVSYGTPEHIEAKRLLALLEWFVQCEPEFIPDNSLLREFIGGSILKDFHIWK